MPPSSAKFAENQESFFCILPTFNILNILAGVCKVKNFGSIHLTQFACYTTMELQLLDFKEHNNNSQYLQ
jgi:hypothetical protein